MYKKILLSMAISLAVFSSTSLLANPANTNTQSPTTKAPTTQQTWLGIGLAPVPEVIRSQLQSVIPAGQGVMVSNVAASSPAQQAGLQQYDVLISYNDQQLYSPRQLSGLVKAAQPNSQVNLQLIRQGQAKSVTVTLGQRDVNIKPLQKRPSYQQWPFQPMQPMMPVQPPSPNTQKNSAPLAWDSFENVQVKTLPDGRYQAEVSYKTPQGDEKKFSFEGKREEIIEQIKQQKQLPESKKKALLNALNMKPGDIFNQPLFQQGFQGFPLMNMNIPNFPQLFQNPPTATKPQGEVL